MDVTAVNTRGERGYTALMYAAASDAMTVGSVQRLLDKDADPSFTAEGDTEDTALGGVFSYDTATGTFRTLARPRDPDQVVQSGLKVLVAAHGDRDVLAIEGGQSSVWARGAAAVAIAPDPSLNLLVLAVNAHE